MLAAAAMAGGMVANQHEAMYARQDLTAVMLGRELMEEVLSRPFAAPGYDGITAGHSAGDIRTNYTYISDYSGYTDSTSAIEDQGGDSLTVGNGRVYTRSVSVTYKSFSYPYAPPAQDCALVGVTVTEPTGRSITLYRVATRVELKQ